MRYGLRGLEGKSSLIKLLAEHRKVRDQTALPNYTHEKILTWADAYHARSGKWPTCASGTIPEAPGETWGSVHSALWSGRRGLSRGSSLRKLLAMYRQVRNDKDLPHLSERKILGWADAFHHRHARWPHCYDGPIPEAPGESWQAVQVALANGNRGLPGGSSLAQLLEKHRGHRNIANLPALTEEQITGWADAFHAKTGAWPSADSGAITKAPGETWGRIDNALRYGLRSLPGGSSLSHLLMTWRGVRNIQALPRFTTEEILAWVDAYHQRTGNWPTAKSGEIREAHGDTWGSVESALMKGTRGLPGGSSVARFLTRHRGFRNRQRQPRLTIAKILTWANSHRLRTGKWPTRSSGVVHDDKNEKWRNIDNALRYGLRGLSGGSSLARLLAERHAVRNIRALPAYTIAQIVSWADAHYERTGTWPLRHAGAIQGTNGETWMGVEMALAHGGRGLPGGSSLRQLLEAKRNVRNPMNLPPLDVGQILAWADAHHRRTGEWPRQSSGRIHGTKGETWNAVGTALEKGGRGLPGGLSLGQLLADHRNVRNLKHLPRLSINQILAWADAHKARTGAWPKCRSGPIEKAPGETWMSVEQALNRGKRSLPGNSSVAKLLAEHRGVRNIQGLTRLTITEILAWADTHHARTGHWPKKSSGPIQGVKGETWALVSLALERGRRGLPGGSSLARLLAEHCGVRNRKALPPLTTKQILAWAHNHQRRTASWPTERSGAVVGADGETWLAVDMALRNGGRGLPGGDSLSRLLAREPVSQQH